MGNLKADYLVNFSKTLEMFSKFLGSNSWLAGKSLTFPDFHFYEMLDQHKQLSPSILNKFPNLVAYVKRFEELPEIAAYMASPKFMKAPSTTGWPCSAHNEFPRLISKMCDE